MLKANIEPDIVTYNILASGFCKSGLVMEVFDLLDRMADQGLEPNSLTYGIAIVGFCRGGNLSEAEEVNIADEELSVKIRKENEAPVVERKVKNISDTNIKRLPYLMVLLWLWKTNDRVTLLWFYSFF
uniref:Pentatricopeptide repeat-containing protein n=1 Tax=Oryza nivara TaxID=4536 RepID=A0A0E0I9T8_ORYNI